VFSLARSLKEGGIGYFAAMCITAIVQNDTITLPVHVPDGTRVEIKLLIPKNVPHEKAPNPLAWMLKYAGYIDGPVDFAANRRRIC